jgi:acetolactate synthase-1/2/3 large subunit
VKEPQTIRYHLEKAWHLCKSGRPGPCWLDIPIDVQSSQIDPEALQGCIPDDVQVLDESHLQEICAGVLSKLINAERPVILAGKGIRLGDALSEYEDIIRALRIPVVPGWTSIDLIPSDDPLFGGRAGDLATRGGNFTVQNSDVLLVLGTR